MPATVAQARHSRSQLLRIVAVVLGQVGVVGETEDKCPIETAANHLTEELSSGLLFETKAWVDRCAGVHQQAKPQRQLALMPECRNPRHRPVIVHDADIFPGKVLDEFVPIGSSKEDGHLIYSLLDSPGIGTVVRSGTSPSRRLAFRTAVSLSRRLAIVALANTGRQTQPVTKTGRLATRIFPPTILMSRTLTELLPVTRWVSPFDALSRPAVARSLCTSEFSLHGWTEVSPWGLIIDPFSLIVLIPRQLGPSTRTQSPLPGNRRQVAIIRFGTSDRAPQTSSFTMHSGPSLRSHHGCLRLAVVTVMKIG